MFRREERGGAQAVYGLGPTFGTCLYRLFICELRVLTVTQDLPSGVSSGVTSPNALVGGGGCGSLPLRECCVRPFGIL
jgi:hypothetical protein